MSLEAYLELVLELLRLREAGPLPEEKEAAYIDELDDRWWSMSAADRARAPGILAARIAGQDDVTITDGDSTSTMRTRPIATTSW